MKPSPVQLMHFTFRKVSVEIDGNVPFDVERLSPLDAFDFQGVTLLTRIDAQELTEKADAQSRGRVFQIAFDFRVDNKMDEDNDSQVFSPYLIDLQAAALIRIPSGMEDINAPEDLAAVNGAALVWGAFREQVSNITSRMVRGPALLPSVNFLDLRNQKLGASSSRPSADGVKRKRRSTKASSNK